MNLRTDEGLTLFKLGILALTMFSLMIDHNNVALEWIHFGIIKKILIIFYNFCLRIFAVFNKEIKNNPEMDVTNVSLKALYQCITHCTIKPWFSCNFLKSIMYFPARTVLGRISF